MTTPEINAFYRVGALTAENESLNEQVRQLQAGFRPRRESRAYWIIAVMLLATFVLGVVAGRWL